MALSGGFKEPKNDSRFSWTSHVVGKMRQYWISESRIRRIVCHPTRIEEGIAPDTVAVMQPGGSTRYHEIWVMYKLTKKAGKQKTKNGEQAVDRKLERDPFGVLSRGQSKLRVITAWRYPGKSPERAAVPDEILREVRNLL